jgi:vacuolar protein sorting-associated protein IST1
MGMFGGFSAQQLKPRLKMATNRFQIAIAKKSALMKQQKREIALMLAEEPLPKEEKARIRTEAIIRDDNTVEAFEILQLQCELLYERMKLIENTKECPSDLVSCVSTLMWASQRVDIAELQEIRKQFRVKYGKKFDEAALSNESGVCNERVVAKLSFYPPSAILVRAYLEKIAEEYEVDWKPKMLRPEEMQAPAAPPTGYSVPIAQGSGLGPAVSYSAVTGLSSRNVGVSTNPGSYAPSSTYTSRVAPFAPPMSPLNCDEQESDITFPSTTGASNNSNNNKGNNNDDGDSNNDDDEPRNGGDTVKVDDLTARFAQLKR